jgi:hypothetical protein
VKFAVKNLPQFKSQMEAAVKTDPAFMDELGLAVKKIIEERSSAGLDAEGNAFAPYSRSPIYVSMKGENRGGSLRPSGGRMTKSGKSMFFEGGYAQYKAKISDRVNLTNTGRMFRALAHRVSGKRLFVGFYRDNSNPSANAKASGHVEGAGNMPKRDFFNVGLIRTEVDAIRALWERWTEARIGKQSR